MDVCSWLSLSIVFLTKEYLGRGKKVLRLFWRIQKTFRERPSGFKCKQVFGEDSQLTITCSKSTIQTLEKGVNMF